MNREALPLIFAIFIPIILVFLIMIQINGYDLTSFFRKIDLIYYIIVVPIALGFMVAIMKYKKV
ncbi:MAG: hypothetical protein KAW47_02100 [Thermoplasmatales archaeon]|nr:hypothetical protein [Thermoplasmatales archaeon]